MRFYRSCKFTALRSLVTQNAWVKEFLHLCSENRISWIFRLFFENAHEWKTHHWNPPEPRTRCNFLFMYRQTRSKIISESKETICKSPLFLQNVRMFFGWKIYFYLPRMQTLQQILSRDCVADPTCPKSNFWLRSYMIIKKQQDIK